MAEKGFENSAKEETCDIPVTNLEFGSQDETTWLNQSELKFSFLLETTFPQF